MVHKIYCSKCGEELPEGSRFCTKCGTPVKLEAKAETVVQSFEKNPQLQDHWIKRVVAYVIDAIIVSIVVGVVLFVALLPFYVVNLSRLVDWFSFPFAAGLLSILYFPVLEFVRGATIGKSAFGLKVVTTTGENLSFEKAFIRNISKIHPILLLLDIIGGVLTSKDLHQKYSDRMVHTTVT